MEPAAPRLAGADEVPIDHAPVGDARSLSVAGNSLPQITIRVGTGTAWRASSLPLSGELERGDDRLELGLDTVLGARADRETDRAPAPFRADRDAPLPVPGGAEAVELDVPVDPHRVAGS